MRKLTKKQSELNFWGAVTGIHGASLKAFRYHLQIVTQRFVALLDVVSNFAAFKICDHRVGNPPPGHPLPFLQLNYFAAQNIRLSHAAGPARLENQILADSQLATSVMEPTMRKFLIPLDGSGCDCLYVPVALMGGGQADSTAAKRWRISDC
jgi:hypothetical protein